MYEDDDVMRRLWLRLELNNSTEVYLQRAECTCLWWVQ